MYIAILKAPHRSLLRWFIKIFGLAFVLALALSTNPHRVNGAEPVKVETKTLNQLYQEALAEGGKLVVWAGGDKPDQQDYIKNAFKKRFPKIDIQVDVDLSKYHDARIDNALAMGGDLPDVAQLQTLHDFDYWKSQGVLLPYKPLDWDQVYPQFKDPDGQFVGVYGLSFSNMVNIDKVPEAEAPRDALDYLKPQFKGKIILTYPHDDDAVLYEFFLLVNQYGWGYIRQLIDQKPKWVRGTAMPYVAVNNGQYPVTFTTFWPLVPFPNSPSRFMLPKKDFFLSWVQTAAIFKKSPHPAAAKLYLNWILSKDFQKIWLQWPVRKDVTAPGDYKSVFHHNTDPLHFRDFIRDRGLVDRFKMQMEQLIGPVEGVSPLEMDYSVIPE